MILDEIVQTKREELAERKSARDFFSLRRAASDRSGRRSFRKSLIAEEISVIAEIKKASPSEGVIREEFDVASIASDYEEGGAAALSVLTDERYFQGHLGYLSTARSAAALPILRKDFVIDEYQIAEAGASGADAFLLIVAILSKSQISEYVEFGRELGLDALVEIHDGHELETAVDAGSEIIGINNRDLRDFDVSLETSFELGPELPDGIIRVSESGIGSPDDVEMLDRAGFHAVLVGTSLMREKSPGEGVARLLGR